jgi:hypothetical protein
VQIKRSAPASSLSWLLLRSKKQLGHSDGAEADCHLSVMSSLIIVTPDASESKIRAIFAQKPGCRVAFAGASRRPDLP